MHLAYLPSYPKLPRLSSRHRSDNSSCPKHTKPFGLYFLRAIRNKFPKALPPRHNAPSRSLPHPRCVASTRHIHAGDKPLNTYPPIVSPSDTHVSPSKCLLYNKVYKAHTSHRLPQAGSLPMPRHTARGHNQYKPIDKPRQADTPCSRLSRQKTTKQHPSDSLLSDTKCPNATKKHPVHHRLADEYHTS